MQLRIVLADDHEAVREGFRILLEREGVTIVGEAANGVDAVRLVMARDPDVAVLDLSMPQLNGLDAAREILQEKPHAGIILLTMHAEEHQIIAALRARIRGYVVKTQAAADLVQAIQEVARGGTYLAPVAARVVSAYLSGSEVAPELLTNRERQVLQLVAEGRTTNEIAGILCLSVKTAECYRARLKDKLDIHETAGLVRYAIRRGLICMGMVFHVPDVEAFVFGEAQVFSCEILSEGIAFAELLM